jgi:hypothetical protein
LFLFSEKVCIDEKQNIWEHTHMCMDINDVLPILDEKFLEISAEAAAKKKTHAATHIFGAKQEGVTKIKPAKKAA